MTRGNARGSQNRGRGGRGHGGHHGGSGFRGGNQGRGRGRGDVPPADFSVLDNPVQIWPQNGSYDDSYRRGSFSPPNRGGSGRGYRGQRGQRGSTPVSRTSTPSRGAVASPDRGTGTGRWHAGIGSPTRQVKQQTQPRLGPDAPLSKLLYETRPLLRPIIFVQSTATPFLFQYEEELLKPVVEDVEPEENPVPTADRVAQVFNGMAIDDTDSDNEELEEIDFTEMHKLLEITAKPIKKLDQAAEEQFTGFYNPNTVAVAPSIAHQNEEAVGEAVSDVPISNVGIVEMAEIPTTSPVCTNGLPTNFINVITPVARVEVTNHLPTLATRTSDDVYLTDVSGPAVTEVALQPDTAGLGNESPSSAANAPLLSHVEETTDEETLPSVAPDAASFGIGITPTPPHTAINDSQDEPNLNNQVLDSIEPAEEEDFYVDATPPITLSINAHSSQNHGATVSMDQTPEPPEADNFYIDTTPAPIAATQPISRSLEAQVALGDEEEVIVYVAPHPRSGRATPAVVESPSTLRMTSVLTGLSTIDEAPQLPQTDKCLPGAGEAAPATTASRFTQTQNPRQFVSPLLLASPSTHRKAKLRVRRHQARLAKKRKDTRSMFSLGAARQEMEWQDPEERDLRWEERRRGDSDIDWGDEDETQATQESTAASDARGMDVDPDLLDEKSMNALGSFANAMLGQAQSNFMTMDDIADADKLREEDEASQGGAEGSSDEDELEEEAVRAALEDDSDEESEEEEELRQALEEEEEKMLPEEDDAFEISDKDDEIDDSSDDDLSPRSSFQTRLDRLRKRSKARDVSLDEDEEADFDRKFTWEDQGDLLQGIEELLDENEDILFGHDHKQKNRLFKAISNGNHDGLSEFTVTPRRKDKAKGLPASLQKQWEEDRAKKAKLKEARQMAQLEAAADPLAKKKGGKKGIKAMLAAAEITVIGPNRVIDMTTLVQQIRRFLANPGGPQTMSLPPTSKASRKLVHEMATTFNLKSQSNGKGDARYTTLIKTSRSGLEVNEKKVGQLVRRGQFAFGGDAWNESKNEKEKGKPGGGGVGGGGGGVGGGPRQKEGEEVGKAAPKIGSSNIGFKMLEAMGWSEGGRIGVTGGLEQPLTAIIKRSKLGLGATKAQ